MSLEPCSKYPRSPPAPRPSRRALISGAAALAGATWSAAPTRAASTLRLGHALPATHPVHRAMENFANVVGVVSRGEIEVRIFADGLLGQETDLLEQARAGTLDIVKLSASVLEGASAGFQVFNLPFLFRDRAHWGRVVEGPVGEGVLQGALAAGLVGLTFYDAGARSFYGQKPIDHPDDLKGLRVRVQVSPAMARMVELLGAEARPMPWSIVFTALQTGLIDAAENNLTALVYGRHAEVIRHYAFTEHTFVPDVLLISARTWNRLTAAQREIMRQAARGSALMQGGLWADAEADSRSRSEALGVAFHRPDKAPFRERLAPMRREFAERFDLGGLIDAVERA